VLTLVTQHNADFKIQLLFQQQESRPCASDSGRLAGTIDVIVDAVQIIYDSENALIKHSDFENINVDHFGFLSRKRS